MVAVYTVGNLLWQSALVGRNTPWTVTRTVSILHHPMAMAAQWSESAEAALS